MDVAEGASTEAEETDEEYILRKTKYFNEETRKQKSNVQLWLDFIAFQDERQKLEALPFAFPFTTSLFISFSNIFCL